MVEVLRDAFVQALRARDIEHEVEAGPGMTCVRVKPSVRFRATPNVAVEVGFDSDGGLLAVLPVAEQGSVSGMPSVQEDLLAAMRRAGMAPAVSTGFADGEANPVVRCQVRVEPRESMRPGAWATLVLSFDAVGNLTGSFVTV